MAIFLKNNLKKEKSSEEFTPKYLKPKILLIDLPTTVFEKVQGVGFNVSTGTFGCPYKVEVGDGYQPVIVKASLPNYTEQEIIFIDLTSPSTIDGPEGKKSTSIGENDWWAKCNKGEIDPRPRAMAMAQDAFDRIFHHGGLFIIFAEPRLYQELAWAKFRFGSFDIDSKLPFDNWSFLSILSPDHLEIKFDFGEEIDIPNYDFPVCNFLKRNIMSASYTATFNPTYRTVSNWLVIANNKFGSSVGGLIVPDNSKGRILILPQLSNKPEVIVTLLKEILPDISPHLFPHVEGARWVERDEYELSQVLNYKTDKIKVQQRAEREVEDIDKKILEERAKYGFLHGVITQTGTDLVKSVKLCLGFIGLKQILDIDEQIKNQNIASQKQEDLQIYDKSPTLLLEIKGISGLPRENDTIQIVKYVSRRRKEWNRFDVYGVSIINHQRNLPALERDNDNVFTEAQIQDAINNDFTLLTTWDLFLLIKGMLRWGWPPETIKEFFYKSGRMSRIPGIYKPLGTIVNYWEEIGVVGIQVSGDKLHKGERIGYITPEGYLEEEVLSLQVDKQDIEEVIPGQIVGIKTIYPKNLLRKGTVVCIVERKT
jgi:hypothetical protein